MPRFTPEEYAAMKRSMLEITMKHRIGASIPDEPEAPVTPRPKSEKVTKSPATVVAEKNATPDVEPEVPEVVEEQVITKPENVIEVPNPSIPKGVRALIGNTYANVKVLSYNADESLIPRGEKQKPLPHVNCECLKCGKSFVVNAYRVSGGSQKSCGCDSKRKAKA